MKKVSHLAYLEGALEDIDYHILKTIEALMAKRKSVIYRSARTGKAVTKAYAKAHPATTEKEVYRRKRTKRRKRRI